LLESSLIRKLNCDGQILPASDFSINTNIPNIASVGNFLIANDWEDDGLQIFDICSQVMVNQICLNGQSFPDFSGTQWGLHYSTYNNTIYATDGFNHTQTKVWAIPLADILSGTCVDPLFNVTNNNYLAGITTDSSGNIYIVENQDAFHGAGGRILKYDSSGNFISSSAFDTNPNDGGYYQAIGIVYSETANALYVSTQSPTDDCVSLFDTDLNYLGPAVPATGFDNQSKGISINKECCPEPSNFVLDIAQCDVSFPTDFYLQELIGCDGTICEGTDFEADAGNVGTTFNSCNSSITVTASGCSTFTKTSDGSGSSNLCGGFSVTLNVCFEATPAAPAISITNNTCDPEAAGSINVDTPCEGSSVLEWSTNAGATWSATQPTYSDAAITVRARCTNDCGSTETADITSAPEECCPPVNCISQFGEFTITKRRP